LSDKEKNWTSLRERIFFIFNRKLQTFELFHSACQNVSSQFFNKKCFSFVADQFLWSYCLFNSDNGFMYQCWNEQQDNTTTQSFKVKWKMRWKRRNTNSVSETQCDSFHFTVGLSRLAGRLSKNNNFLLLRPWQSVYFYPTWQRMEFNFYDIHVSQLN